ncbi:hypothetical protein K440DRAFT_313045 [Wilcoxina mikolae CBS 423.85]|nr:hypothetical protein K440DRAFT_313045 [Wilcoxina mikolae CBS 423.85]
MSRPPPPHLLIPSGPYVYEADSSPIGHSSPPLPNLPDITTITTHLTTLHSSLTSPPSPSFPIPASSLEENWFKLHSPPLELSWLSGEEPKEVTAEVAGFSESLRERYYATTTRGEREIECGLEVVVEEVGDAGSSSGIESNAGSDIFVSPIRTHMSPVRWPGDEAQISRRTSVATTTSSGSTSSGGGGISRLAPKQRNVKHAMVMPGVLLYTPYYTSSAPGNGVPVGPPLVSPRAEAIKKYLKNRKAQRCVCLWDLRGEGC